MKPLSQIVDELLELEGKATEKCITCGSRVGIYSADEGTSSYEPLPMDNLRELCEAVREAEVLIKSAVNNYNPTKSNVETRAWLRKYGGGE